MIKSLVTKLYTSILFTFICYSIISYVNVLLAINMINPLVNKSPLPDIGFDYLPHISSIYPNILVLTTCFYFVVRFFRIKNLICILQLIWCITLLFAIRLFTFTVTIVPPSTIGCINRNSTSPIRWNVIKYLLFSNHNTCTDYMFSGHACYFVIILLFTLKLSNYKLEKLGFIIFTILSLLSIISGHIHYTTDVVVAIFLSIMCYNILSD